MHTNEYEQIRFSFPLNLRNLTKKKIGEIENKNTIPLSFWVIWCDNWAAEKMPFQLMDSISVCMFSVANIGYDKENESETIHIMMNQQQRQRINSTERLISCLDERI